AVIGDAAEHPAAVLVDRVAHGRALSIGAVGAVRHAHLVVPALLVAQRRGRVAGRIAAARTDGDAARGDGAGHVCADVARAAIRPGVGARGHAVAARLIDEHAGGGRAGTIAVQSGLGIA